MSKFSIRLRELRHKYKLSQQALANQMGTSKSSINMYERGEREPGLDAVMAFAKFFKVDTNYILGTEKEKDEMATNNKKRCSTFLTDEEVEREIERLNASEAVALARREQRLKYKRRQYLYILRALEKKGKELLDAGITRDVLDALYSECEED